LTLSGSATAFATPPQALIVTLQPETVRAYETYVSQTEEQLKKSLQSKEPSLWPNHSREGVLRGEIKTDRIARQAVEGGLIHDWIGSVLIRDKSVEDVAGLLTDYDRHKNVYPEVTASRVVQRGENRLKAYLRLRKKHVLTVVLDTEYDVTFDSPAQGRWQSWSRSTRIVEVSNPGSKDEEILPVGRGHGFLWRMNVYWNLVEVPAGTIAECRSISLSRGIPFGLNWIIGPISSELPRESLAGVLRATRDSLAD